MLLIARSPTAGVCLRAGALATTGAGSRAASTFLTSCPATATSTSGACASLTPPLVFSALLSGIAAALAPVPGLVLCPLWACITGAAAAAGWRIEARRSLIFNKPDWDAFSLACSTLWLTGIGEGCAGIGFTTGFTTWASGFTGSGTGSGGAISSTGLGAGFVIGSGFTSSLASWGGTLSAFSRAGSGTSVVVITAANGTKSKSATTVITVRRKRSPFSLLQDSEDKATLPKVLVRPILLLAGIAFIAVIAVHRAVRQS